MSWRKVLRGLEALTGPAARGPRAPGSPHCPGHFGGTGRGSKEDGAARGPPAGLSWEALPSQARSFRYGAKLEACHRRLERPCIRSAALSPV